MAPDAIDLHVGRHHERQVGRAGSFFGKHGSGGRPLQGDKREPVLGVQGHALRQTRPDMRVIRVLHGGVDDEIEPTLVAGGSDARDHQVVEDAAVVGKKLRIALLIGFQAHDIRRNERFERPCHGFVALVLGDQESLAHVGNIEQARMLAGPVVLGHDAGGVLDRHVIAGERHHARAKGNMLGMKGGLQRLVGVDRLGHGISSKARVRRAFQGPFFTPPLSHDLRDFPNATSERLRPSVGDVAKRRRFPECQLPSGPFA